MKGKLGLLNIHGSKIKSRQLIKQDSLLYLLQSCKYSVYQCFPWRYVFGRAAQTLFTPCDTKTLY